MTVSGPIAHTERLSIVDHLDELRSRIIVSLGVLVVLFSLCYWQSDRVLNIANRPLDRSQKADSKSKDPLERAAAYDVELGAAMRSLTPALRNASAALTGLAARPGVPAADRLRASRAARSLDQAARATRAAAAATPKASARRPITTGVAEPFTATITVAAYAALLLALPFLLFQLYSFVLPAFRPGERKVALPLMLLVPVLFTSGVMFGYFVALPRATTFLLNFNDDRFDILVQARDYYKFVILVLALTGLTFQIPVAVLAITRTGLLTAGQLWKNQGYVILALSIIAAVATPTPDPVTMLITMLPLMLLYELSIGLAYLLRPRGPTVGSRFGTWWDEEDGDEPDEDGDEADEDGDEPDTDIVVHAADAGNGDTSVS